MQKTMLLLGNKVPPSALALPVATAGGKLTHTPDLPTTLTLAAQGAELLLVTDDTDLPSLFAQLKANRLTLPVIVCGLAQPALGAKAIRLGATEYLTLPLDARLLEAIFKKFLSADHDGGHDGKAPAPIMGDHLTEHLFQQAQTYAASNATVLLRGESGTGKEVFANFIHRHSPRKNAPFIAVNCAAIPENLLESELFGHEKGAFSGALTRRLGKFQQADGGTLLLDEISEMDLSLQAKLLRAIQERVVDPIGADKPVPVDIRLIATTNRQLEAYVAEGKFREDLYFRLNVVALDIPPLRERPGDILPLAQHFATRYARGNNLKHTPSITEGAADKLHGCYWKGNVRELENTLHRAVLLAGSISSSQGSANLSITENHIVLSPMSLEKMSVAANTRQAGTQPSGPGAAPLAQQAAMQAAQAVASAYATGGAGGPSFVPRTLAAAERTVLTETLAYTQGNRQYAADLLGISILILKEKLNALGLTEA